MTVHLLITEPDSFSQEARQILSGFCEIDAQESTYASLSTIIHKYDILFIRLGIKFDRKLLAKASRLSYLVSPTTGLDHIDLEAAQEFGIHVLSLKGETEFLRQVSATAELAWGLILSLLRNLPWAFEDVKKGNWERDRFRGHELSALCLGILGLGRLGEKVARYGLAAGMPVMAYDPFRQDWPANIMKAESIEQLLATSQILSIHIPLNAETENLIGARELALMPAGAWLINTSRGKIVNEKALLQNLESGHLAGAGVDVISDENQGENTLSHHPLITYAQSHRNLIITPHIGGATFESMQKTEVFMANKLKQAMAQASPASEK